MNTRQRKTLLVVTICAFFFIAISAGTIAQASLRTETSQIDESPPSSQTATNMVYVPFVKMAGPVTVFGVENYYFGASKEMDFTKEMGAYWLRRNGALWMDVEPNKGDRKWSVMASMEKEFTYSADLGKKITLVVRRTPVWARKYSGSECGPIKDQEIASFANFMYDLVKRYSAPPYSVLYYEIWNEPEAPLNTDPQISFGCWGDANDPYSSARHMAQVLKQVYPKIKEANPTAQVLFGGLVLDCDPINPPAGKDCRSSKFLEILLQEGAGPYFDIVSFHAYDYWSGALGWYDNFNWGSAWNTTGSVVIAKANYLNKVLNDYGFGDKKLMATEISLLCMANCGSESQETKSYYVAEAYGASIISGIQGTYWYSQYDNWRENGLIDDNPAHVPHPAFYAYKFAKQELGSAVSGKDVSDSANFIYEIYTPKGTLWLMWSKDGKNHNYTFSTTPVGVKDVYGNSKSVSKTMLITVAPIYVEWFSNP